MRLRSLAIESTASDAGGDKLVGGKRMILQPGPVTGQTKLPGVRVDFNFGARVQVPAGNWRVRFIDMDTRSILADLRGGDTVLGSPKRYFVRYRVEVYEDEQLVLQHHYDDKGQKVLIKSLSNAIGDNIAWIPYIEEYRRRHACEVYLAVSTVMAELLAASYPEFHFIGPEERPVGCYASYYPGTIFPATDRAYQPYDWRVLGLQRSVAAILGLPQTELAAHLQTTDCPEIKEPYVCIAVQASALCKYWNNPTGWYEVVKYLKEQGYRVLCIDRDRCYGRGLHYHSIPWGAEDFTGELPLAERAALIAGAQFFIGLSSGLSWLAWAVGTPVVLISGVTLPMNEFATPYRIINPHVCNGCWNDTQNEFRAGEFEWCPRHAGDLEQQFICTRMIAPGQVTAAIERLRHDRKNVKK